MVARTKKNNVWTEAEQKAWAMPSDTSVSQWAERNIVLPDTTPEPGPWRNDRAPYLAGIMDAYTDWEVEEITIVGPAQCGKTQAVFNMIGYTVEMDPQPSMYVIPRDEDCDYISDDRILPLIHSSPGLNKHLTGRSRDILKGTRFAFDRMPLYFAGAGSVSDLTSKAIGRLFCDETDKYRYYVSNEGNPIKLAYRRGTAFGDFKAAYLCTVTTKNGFIYISYHQSNMMTYHVPCPACNKYIRLLFGCLKVTPSKLRDPEEILEKECVYYECQRCKERIPQSEKQEMVAKGVWCPAGQTVRPSGNLTGKPKRGKRHTGFWIDSLLSPWLQWPKMLAEWFRLNTPEGIATGALREFKNQVLVQAWEDQAIDIESGKLTAKRGDFSQGTIPSDCKILIAGADYHKKESGDVRIDYEVRGFGIAYRNWVVSSGSVSAPNKDDAFDELVDLVLMEPFPWSDPDKKEDPLVVTCMFIDANYEPDDVCGFCRMYPGVVFPTKGRQKQRAPLITSHPDRDQKERQRYKGLVLYLVDTTYFKNQVSSWADAEPNEPRGTQYYAEIPDRYFTEFTNEHKVEKRDKKTGQINYVWEPVVKGRPTHFLDTAVLTAAAAHKLRVYLLRPETTGETKQKIPAVVKKARSKKKVVKKIHSKSSIWDGSPEI
ncbi:MAG: phage terminase large subunit family protein [Gammaproteobacteria bacterium]|nr:phage terminase large subunit family protein [Gammaproteobacteria bacterium]